MPWIEASDAAARSSSARARHGAWMSSPDAPYERVVTENIQVGEEIPQIVPLREDAGPYITASVCIAKASGERNSQRFVESHFFRIVGGDPLCASRVTVAAASSAISGGCRARETNHFRRISVICAPPVPCMPSTTSKIFQHQGLTVMRTAGSVAGDRHCVQVTGRTTARSRRCRMTMRS